MHECGLIILNRLKALLNVKNSIHGMKKLLAEGVGGAWF
jgi:hypothetical protein